MTGSANLVINSNYVGSGVPVADGVGPVANKVALTRWGAPSVPPAQEVSAPGDRLPTESVLAVRGSQAD